LTLPKGYSNSSKIRAGAKGKTIASLIIAAVFIAFFATWFWSMHVSIVNQEQLLEAGRILAASNYMGIVTAWLNYG
jgi:hypothetical protein